MYYYNQAAAALAQDEPTGSRTWEILKSVAENPVMFGIGIGVANGLIATLRKKPVSIRANLVTAAVVGAGEAALLEDQPTKKLVSYALLSALGATIGLALFTRWDKYNRAIVELDTVPAPPLPPELQEAVAAYGMP